MGDFGKEGLTIATKSVSNSNAGFFSDQPVTEQGPAVWGRVTQRASQFSVSLGTVACIFAFLERILLYMINGGMFCPM